MYKKKEVEDKIDTAAVTVADAIRQLEFKLGGKKQIVRKSKTPTQVAETKNCQLLEQYVHL